MKDLMLDKNGDVVIENGKIKLVSDSDLVVQQIRQVLSTNLGEWKYNPEEGIDMQSILVKNPNIDVVESIIKEGLTQVDSSLRLKTFECEVTNRKFVIHFNAVNSSDEEINVELEL